VSALSQLRYRRVPRATPQIQWDPTPVTFEPTAFMHRYFLRKLPYFVSFAALACGITLAFGEVHFSSGPLPSFCGVEPLGGKPAENNCTACHITFDDMAMEIPNLNLPGGAVEILDLPALYDPGDTYPIRVRLASDSTEVFPGRLWGFQIGSVAKISGEGAGTWILPSDSLQIVTGYPGDYATRNYVEHTTIGTRPGLGGPVEWTFSWRAPDPGVGTVGFYIAGNAANGNGGPDGDFIYTAHDSVPDASTSVARVSWGKVKAKYR
jgi:hypothetical protein